MVSRYSKPPTTSRAISSLQSVSQRMSIAVTLIGLIVLLGWIFNVPLFKSVWPGLVTMKANTAISFIICGLSLWQLGRKNSQSAHKSSQQNRRRTQKKRKMGTWKILAHQVASILPTLSYFTILIGVLTLLQYILNINFGIDEWLFQESANAVGTSMPGRMAPNTAFNFVLLGFALVFSQQKRYRMAQSLSAIAWVIAFLGLLGYLYGISAFYGLGRSTEMALHTSIGFILLSVGVLLANPDRGPVSLLTNERTLRLLMQPQAIAALFLPPLLGGLILQGTQLNLYDRGVGIALLSVLNTILLAIAIGWNAHTLSIMDARREQAEREQYLTAIAAARSEELQKTLIELQAADAASKAKGEFLSKMSHELRTPLNVILGFTQILNRDNSLKSQQQDYLGIISRAGEHLLTLINDVLEMSKIEAGQISLNETSFDLYRLLTTLEEMFRLKAQSKGLNIIFERTPHLPIFIKTDESKLRQVLINLLGNAIKFTETGGVAVRVATQQELSEMRSQPDEETDSYLVCEIEDTGPGISAEELDSLFDPFFQSETGRKSQSGTGLGLPISRQFVELMGGEITVSSSLDKGTILKFNIKISPAEGISATTQSSGQRVIGLAPNQPAYRILVVEDKWESRLVLKNLLEPLGFEVKEAVNGAEAVTMWQSWQPHLIWMDMQMPVMDGYEATKQIKQSQSEQIPVIIGLTASAFEENRIRVLEAGCDDFASKPFREQVIFEKMAEHLGVRYVYEEVRSSDVSDPQRSGQSEAAVLTDCWQRMPQEWKTQLHQAARELDDEAIATLTAQIPDSDAVLADQITNFATHLRFDKILELIENPEQGDEL